MATTRLEFVRTYSFFQPQYTYNVYDHDPFYGSRWIGAVARNPGKRKWWASNKTWAGGDDLPETFRTRHDAALALRRLDEEGQVPGLAPRSQTPGETAG